MSTTTPAAHSGDLVDVSVKLRRLLTDYDTAAYLLDRSYAAIDPELEALAIQLRPAAADVASLTYAFLERLEKLPGFTKQRAAYLANRRA